MTKRIEYANDSKGNNYQVVYKGSGYIILKNENIYKRTYEKYTFNNEIEEETLLYKGNKLELVDSSNNISDLIK